MTNVVHPYWQIPEHHRWREHYISGNHGGTSGVLGFTAEFRERFLPGDMTATKHANDLLIEVLDTKTSKTYPCRHVVAYDLATERGSRYVMDVDWKKAPVDALGDYFYGCHFCGCHVAHHIHHHTTPPTVVEGYHDVELSDDEHCPRQRFKLVKIVYEKMPELILWSETLKAEELEERLHALPGAPERIGYV